MPDGSLDESKEAVSTYNKQKRDIIRQEHPNNAPFPFGKKVRKENPIPKKMENRMITSPVLSVNGFTV